MKHPKLTIGLGVLGALALGLLMSSTSPQPPAGPLPMPKPWAPGVTKLTAQLSDEFFRRVEAMAAYFRSRGATTTSEDLLAVFLVESSGVNPASRNPWGCVGLNQICRLWKDPDPLSGLRAVGWKGTEEEYLALPAEDQLTYVTRYFDNTNGGRSYPRIRDYGSLYLVNFAPTFLGSPDSTIIFRRGDKEYGPNAGVDSGSKGYIDVGDMARFVKRGVTGSPARWSELMMRLERVRQAVPSV